MNESRPRSRVLIYLCLVSVLVSTIALRWRVTELERRVLVLEILLSTATGDQEASTMLSVRGQP